MSKEMDEAIDKFYEKTIRGTFEGLLNLIEEQMSNSNGIVVEKKEGAEITTAEAKKFVLSLPKFTPSENWGRAGSAQRDEILKYIIRATPYGKPTKLSDFQKTMDYLTRIFDEASKVTSPGRIISSLILMESLASALNAFTESAAGFVFEGWLAAMLGGTQVSDTTEKGNLPIQDIIAFKHPEFPGIPMSLKLLTKGGTSIHGSYTNLVDAMDEFGAMPYVVALKSGIDKEQGTVGAISVHLFQFTKDNLVNALAARAKKLLPLREGAIDPATGEPYVLEGDIVEEYNKRPWPERYAMLQQSIGYSEKQLKKIRARAEKAKEDAATEVQPDPEATLEESWIRDMREGRGSFALHEGKGAAGGSQWHLTQKDMERFADTLQHLNIGTIDLTAESLIEAARVHMKNLNESVRELFTQTAELSDNLNNYFVRPKRDRAIKSGEAAAANAKAVEKAARCAVEQEKEKRAKN